MLACLVFQVGLLLSVMPIQALAAPPAVSHGMAVMASMADVHGHAHQCHHRQPCDPHQDCEHGSESCCLSGAACMTGWAMASGASSLIHVRFVTVAFGTRYALANGGVASAPALPPPRTTA
ncbi:hypothetical protein CFR73_10705 [Novacetimonas maltaceti]|uniref:WAP domain-containing protein n=1 Tax=Novacetimonas maltaceti TaxID=1203393 RepID=A0A2S3W1X5_9PROT|nr:hypothetical protein [Novacetimonas maltaceti]POF62860.1 hypothetical protein KMAL_14700 [Novacetimonas maltaceti]PYD59626.1 hypothetical protein CFR73_10705 [Novacetimonas maltaceti]